MPAQQPDPDPRRRIPRTDVLLADVRLDPARQRLGQDAVRRAVRLAQDQARRGEIAPESVGAAAAAALAKPTALRTVINATGVILHTNLGRAPLSAAATAALNIAAGYVDIEYDTATGTRARRGKATLAALHASVPAAEDVHVVNNGAAALVLAATALASGREIVVSRSELVEIGDGFRLPDLLESTGARLREVGTTNRTKLADYSAAIGPQTGFILKVHQSNFRIVGFTSGVAVSELARLPVPVVADIGSGLLAPDPCLPDEPDVTGWLTAGATLVTASADKLLGGPQAGLIFGRSGTISVLRRHPLARALRTDKLTLAALEATLRGPDTPTAVALHADPARLRARAETLAAALAAAGIPAAAVPTVATVGGGAAPGVELPSWALQLPMALAQPLRAGSPCVVGRIADGHCLLDLRCVQPDDDTTIAAAITVAAHASSG